MNNLIQKFKTIISYIPILWNDEDYDYHYLNVLLLHKLKRMKHHHNNCIYISKEKRPSIKALSICIEILQREIDDFYWDTFSYLIDGELTFTPINDTHSEISKDWKISSHMELYNKKNLYAEKCKERDKRVFAELFKTYKYDWWI